MVVSGKIVQVLNEAATEADLQGAASISPQSTPHPPTIHTHLCPHVRELGTREHCIKCVVLVVIDAVSCSSTGVSVCVKVKS